ncbi:MAG: 23S rRNA (adenine(2030)-N(6))-methyltransferase RlmJ [Treponema sp.]|nr:23S rRNA (adenine(2030)-N(6))-methyltransferase RlmJ [Treponema sp.]
MLSYRHSFHAGSAADVLKHSILVYCLEYLTQKEKGLLCADTHAGAGLYQAGGDEWKKGMGRLLDYQKKTGNYPAWAAGYMKLANQNDCRMYPGSPILMAQFLRRQDRLVCFELHPKDFADLENNMKTFKLTGKISGAGAETGAGTAGMENRGRPSIQTRREDGPASLESLLPPQSGRGLVLIDPSWEEKEEYASIPNYVKAALKRFPQGTYIIWYPMLLNQKVRFADNDSIGTCLFKCFDVSRCRIELYDPELKSGIRSPRGMYGSGLVIFNPPWTLKNALDEIMPYLSGALMDNGKWNLEWTEKCNKTPVQGS